MSDLPTKINLTIVTRERKIVDVAVDEVVMPGTDGELGILPGHTPLLALLGIGQLRYRSGSTISRMVISWGFAEVLPGPGDRPRRARIPPHARSIAPEPSRIASRRKKRSPISPPTTPSSTSSKRASKNRWP